MLRRLAIVLIAVVSLPGTGAFSQVVAWGLTGQGLITVNADQTNIAATTTANGNVFFTYEDVRNGAANIYCMISDTSGPISAIIPGGIPVALNPAAQANASVVADGTGGAVVAWEDSRTPANGVDIYAQRIMPNGIRFWNGGQPVPVCTFPRDQTRPVIVNGPSGSFYVVWSDARSSGATGLDIYIQRLDMTGLPVTGWIADGTPVCQITGDQTGYRVVSDGNGGVIVFWNDKRVGGNFQQVFAQRVDSTGQMLWTPNGVNVSGNTHLFGNPVGIIDGLGGAIIAYADSSLNDNNILAQRIDGTGAVQWTAGGVTVCNAIFSQTNPAIVSDARGGALIAWQDRRGGSRDIYMQRVDGTGTAQWIANGIGVCTVTGEQFDPRLAIDGYGGAIATWTDSRAGGPASANIFANHVDPNGTLKWLATGMRAGFSATQQKLSVVVTEGLNGHAIVLWEDSRNAGATGIDIYGQDFGFVPKASSSRPLVDFGIVRTFTTKTDTIRLRNIGTDTLRVDSCKFSGPAADSVFLVVKPIIFPFKLSPGADSIITIQFRPNKNTPNIDSVIFHTNALGTDSLFHVALTGSGKYPHLKASSDAIAFGGVRMFTTKTIRFVVRNIGSDSGHITQHTFLGSFKDQYTDSATTYKVIKAGDSLAIFVSVTPTRLGVLTTQLQFITDDSTSPYTIQVSATGIFPKTKLTSLGLTFGKVRTSTSKSLTVGVVNTGTDTLHIKNLVFSGNDSTKFTFAPVTLPKALKPKDTLKVVVSFRPDSLKTFRSVLQIFTDDTSQFYAVNCVGTGSFAILELQSEINFGVVAPPKAPDSLLVLRYTGNDTAKVLSGILTGSTKFSISGVVFPLLVTAGQTQVIHVHYAPDTIATDNATLTLIVQYTGGTRDTLTVSLIGNAPNGVFTGVTLPVGVTLDPSYPNPVMAGTHGSGEATIIVNADHMIAFADVAVFNAAGQQVQSLHQGSLIAGTHRFAINAALLPAGTYLCRLATHDGAMTRMFTVVR